MSHIEKFSHIAVRFPPDIHMRLLRLHRLGKSRSFTAVVRAEVEARIDEWEPGAPIRSQSVNAPRSELWLPRGLVAQLRTIASRADAKLGDLVVTMLSTDCAVSEPRRAPHRAQLGA